MKKVKDIGVSMVIGLAISIVFNYISAKLSVARSINLVVLSSSAAGFTYIYYTLILRKVKLQGNPKLVNSFKGYFLLISMTVFIITLLVTKLLNIEVIYRV